MNLHPTLVPKDVYKDRARRLRPGWFVKDGERLVQWMYERKDGEFYFKGIKKVSQNIFRI